MLGARIAALRRRKDMNQGTMAQKLGVSTSAVGMYEQGRREPGAEVLVAMGALLGVTVDFLLTGQPVTEADRKAMEDILRTSILSAQEKLDLRRSRGFTKEELSLVIAAMLTEA